MMIMQQLLPPLVHKESLKKSIQVSFNVRNLIIKKKDKENFKKKR